MQNQRTRSGIRVTALALLAVVGIAGVTVASASDDPHAAPSHAAPSHAAPSHAAPSHAAPGHSAPTQTPAAKPQPKAKPAPKQLAPSSHGSSGHGGSASASDDAHDSSSAEPAKSAKPASERAEDAPARSSAASSASSEPTGPLTADQALALLTEGNQRWVADKERNPNATPQRREQTAGGQNPFATVLTCADSRVPVERVFDRGVGDVFVIRVAGNVAGQSETGTIEYGVEHLKTPVLVVMGHTKCGAVAAAASGASLHGALGGLVDHIKPAVDRARSQNPGATPEQIAAAAVRENVWQTIYDLYSSSPELRSFASNGSVKVVGAVYDIHSGQVEWIGEHPWQREIISALNSSNTSADTAVASSSSTKAPMKPAADDHGHEAHADADTHDEH